MNSEHDDLIGRTVLGRYRIVHRLASGGMGVIYLARSEGAKGFIKPVVIKRILPHLVGEESLVGMFAREARIMSNLSHPGIVGIVDFAEEDGAYLMVLEYVHGFHLGRWNRYIRRTGELFPIEPAIHIVISVLDALHYAHTLTGPDGEPLRIVHRDISPGNVLIDTEGRIKLTDFGIARMRTDKTAASDKRALKGTFSYMAPELLKMIEPSPKIDLYSFDVVLHEILSGKNEFYSKDVASTAWRVLEHVPTPIEEVRPDVPAGLGAVLRKGLAKAPEDRYADAAEFAQALRRARAVSPEEAGMMVAELAWRDFSKVDMATSLGVADLSTLDRKWRQSVRRLSLRPSGRPTLSGRRRRSDPATIPTAPVSATITERVGDLAQRKGVIVGVGVGLVIVGAAFFAMRRRPDDAPPPGVILVEGSVSAVGLTAQSAAPPDTASIVSTKAVEPAQPNADPSGHPSASSAAPPSTSKNAPAKSRSELLTRAFARQQSNIGRCFSKNASDISGNPEISVRFEVGTDGRVMSAQVQPAALASTPLGQCIATVARSTEFGAQPETTTFRIPITAKRGP